MTKTYHDVQAVTRLLEEKEKDLELAAKIGQELLQRNKESDEKISRLELELSASAELITQLRHELQVKTDLLHVYTSDLEDTSPLELRTFNVDILQKKIGDLEYDNRTLHAEATKLAHEALVCEEKEEKLVKDAVQHLTQANMQIRDLHDQFSGKVDESSRQREEINSLLSQVCDLQNRVQRYSHDNDDLTANLRVYQETQDELTTELVDVKEKYREVVGLLKDAQEEIKRNRKRTYPGVGSHIMPGGLSLPSSMQAGGEEDSLQAELHSSLQSSKKSSKPQSKIDSEVSDSENDGPSLIGGSSAYRKVARTFRAISKTSIDDTRNKMNKSVEGSLFQSYTISRENSISDLEDYENRLQKIEDHYVSDDSGNGRSTGLSGPSSLSSSQPKEEAARELLKQATQNSRQNCQVVDKASSHLSSSLQTGISNNTSKPVTDNRSANEVEVIEVQTVGVLKPPSFHMSSSLLHSTPLGSLPEGQIAGPRRQSTFSSNEGHPALGTIPGKSFHQEKEGLEGEEEHLDFDETEPLGQSLTSGMQLDGHRSLGRISANICDTNHGSRMLPKGWLDSENHIDFETLSTISIDFDETHSFDQDFTSGVPHRGHPGLGSIPRMSTTVNNSNQSSRISYNGMFNSATQENYETLSTISLDFDETEPARGLTTNTCGSTLAGRQGLGLGSVKYQGAGLDSENTKPSHCSELSSTWSNQKLSKLTSDYASVHKGSEKGEPSKFPDSGITSWDYSDKSLILPQKKLSSHPNVDIDSLSDGGFIELGNYPGIRMPSDKDSTDSNLPDLEIALKHLNPAEVERRRKQIGQNYSYDLESEMGSPGALAGCEEYFRSLPYGVENPDTSTAGFNNSWTHSRNSVSSMNYRNRKLPEKLRIVKPLEGSLTLHQWSRLATPHLGGVLEERVGVAVKGNEKAGLDSLFDIYHLSDVEEDEGEMSVPSVRQLTKPLNTLTNSTVLHPDTTQSTNSYGRVQMSSGRSSLMNTRPPSGMSSRQASYSDIPSMLGANDIGLSKLLHEQKIVGARRSQLDLSGISNVTSLTPSVLTSPNASKNISPTYTPCHTPLESLPGSPEDEKSDGIVYSFFSSLKQALYGEQRKAHRSSKQKFKMAKRRKSLGIMETVEEIGVENLLREKVGSGTKQPVLPDFDARYLCALDDFDELEDIKPGLLTLTQSIEPERDPHEYTKQWIGQLSLPSYPSHSSLQQRNFGGIPTRESQLQNEAKSHNDLGGRGPGRMESQGDDKPENKVSGMGVPGRPGTGAVGQALGSRRIDLGTIPGKESLSAFEDENQLFSREVDRIRPGMPHSKSFIGSFTSMFFGRKGGYS